MTPCFILVVCNKLTTVWAPTKKLLVSWQFSGLYGVTKYGSGWRKDVVNQCWSLGSRHTQKAVYSKGCNDGWPGWRWSRSVESTSHCAAERTCGTHLKITSWARAGTYSSVQERRRLFCPPLENFSNVYFPVVLVWLPKDLPRLQYVLDGDSSEVRMKEHVGVVRNSVV